MFRILYNIRIIDRIENSKISQLNMPAMDKHTTGPVSGPWFEYNTFCVGKERQHNICLPKKLNNPVVQQDIKKFVHLHDGPIIHFIPTVTNVFVLLQCGSSGHRDRATSVHCSVG